MAKMNLLYTLVAISIISLSHCFTVSTVGGDGCVYEGRGWDSQGAHTKGYNVKTIGLGFIGTFNKYVPPQRQLNAALNILKEGVKLKKLDPNYRLYGHRQLMPTESPGAALYEIIKTWPHWSEDIA